MNSKEISRQLYEIKLEIKLTRDEDKINCLRLKECELFENLKRTLLLENGYVLNNDNIYENIQKRRGR